MGSRYKKAFFQSDINKVYCASRRRLIEKIYLWQLHCAHSPFSEKSVPAQPKPELAQAVFIKVLESKYGVEVKDESGADRGETINLMVGDQHLLQYNVVKGLLEDGTVALI